MSNFLPTPFIWTESGELVSLSRGLNEQTYAVIPFTGCRSSGFGSYFYISGQVATTCLCTTDLCNGADISRVSNTDSTGVQHVDIVRGTQTGDVSSDVNNNNDTDQGTARDTHPYISSDGVPDSAMQNGDQLAIDNNDDIDTDNYADTNYAHIHFVSPLASFAVIILTTIVIVP